MFTAARFQSFDVLDFSARKTDAPEKGQPSPERLDAAKRDKAD
ncbi:hypothetical protein AAFX91_14660 [Bradyrhizobium sp. 31Argb]|nr:hypothetical protein [Bradyrhizobium sp. Leo170]